MLADLAFPGSVMVIKLVLKIAVEQEIKRVDCFKAFLAFPVDIAFLSLSFGSAILLTALSKSTVSESGKILLSFVVISLILATIVTVMCRKSDKAFNKDNNRSTIVWVSLGYFVSILLLLASVEMGKFL